MIIPTSTTSINLRPTSTSTYKPTSLPLLPLIVPIIIHIINSDPLQRGGGIFRISHKGGNEHILQEWNYELAKNRFIDANHETSAALLWWLVEEPG